MYYYHAYNLRLSSEVELPFLPPAPPGDDIILRITPRDKQAVPSHNMDCSYHVTPRLATLAYAELGTLTVIEGREIRATLHPDADESILPLYLTGAAMAVLLYQRGMIVLHASAISLEGRAVVFMSDSGGGKSAMAAVLHRRGHGLLADDFAAITIQHGRPVVIPGLPMIRLDQETAVALGEDLASLQPIHPREPRRALLAESAFASTPRPLSAVYMLQASGNSNLSCLPLKAGLAALMHNTYPAYLLQPGGIDHMRQCRRLFAAIAVFHLARHATLAGFLDLAMAVEGHCLPRTQDADERAVARRSCPHHIEARQ